jgi:hypothetical protein
MTGEDFVDFDLEPVNESSCTVAGAGRGSGTYKRTDDVVHRYAHVEVIVAPHPGIRCYRFAWRPAEASLPLPWMKSACLEGVKQALGSPLDDGRRIAFVEVVVVDGSYHARDTDEQSIAIASLLAVRDALSNAQLVGI